MKKYILIIAILLSAIHLNAQQKAQLTAKYEGGDVVLYYPVPSFSTLDSVRIKVFRMSAKQSEKMLFEKKVPTNSMWFYADTSTRKIQGVYDYRIETSVDTAVLQNETVTAFAFSPDLIPIVKNLTAINSKNTNQINLKWNLANDFVVRTVMLERSRKKDIGFIQIATLNAKDTSYVDEVDDANEPFFYRLQMENIVSSKTFYSTISHVVPDFEIKPLMATNIQIKQENKDIVLTWNNLDKNTTGFYVMRKNALDDTFTKASQRIDTVAKNQYRWIDREVNLSNHQTYQYYVLSESNSFTLSNPSDTVLVAYQNISKALSPPQQLQILKTDSAFNLVWQVDSLRLNEIAAYMVYRKSKTEPKFSLLNDAIVTSNLNYLTMPSVQDGDTFYVTSVYGDKESVPSTKITYNDAFEKEFGPKYLRAAIIDGVLNLRWLSYNDENFKAFKLYKWDGRAFKLVEQLTPEKDRTVVKAYEAGNLNMYKLTTVNKQGLESNGSKILQVN